MRVTTGPRRHVVAVVVAALAVNVELLIFATVGGTATQDDTAGPSRRQPPRRPRTPAS
jgi:hypothetical protein